MSSKIKQKLYSYCETYVSGLISRISTEIIDYQASANEETKSSAGDKYETGRAMAQLEVERSTAQLREAEKLRMMLQTINPGSSAGVVVHGSLVSTSRGVFYVAISIGKVNLDEKEFFVVSPESPIGKSLLGRKPGDEISWANQSYYIQSVE